MPAIALPPNMSGYRPQDVGLLTHAALAVVAENLAAIPEGRLVEYVLDVTGSLVNGDNVNRRRSLQQTAAGYVCTYLRRFAPTRPWQVIEAEFQTGLGRTDIAWRNDTTGQVFFDEIKTNKGALADLPAAVLTQARHQATGGAAEFGDGFLGVRVIPFGSLHLTALVGPDGDVIELDPAPLAPVRRRATLRLVNGGVR